MSHPLPYLKETASQTAGPYVHIGLIPHMAGFEIFEKNVGNVLAGPNTRGERIVVEGRVFDGAGTPLRDVLLEIWQANAAGRYNHPEDTSSHPLDDDFRGFGRAGSDSTAPCTRSKPSSRARSSTRTAAPARRISMSGSSRAASTSGSTPEFISRTRRRRTQPIRC